MNKPQFDYDEAVGFYLSGASATDTAKRFKTGRANLLRVLREKGVRCRELKGNYVCKFDIIRLALMRG